MSKPQPWTSPNGLALRLGVKRTVVEAWIRDGKIECSEGRIHLQMVEKINAELTAYVTLESFLSKHDNARFDSKYVTNRNKYIDYLEANHCFGLKTAYPQELQFWSHVKSALLFLKSDIDLLEQLSAPFFRFFGLTEPEKCNLIISECSNKVTANHLTRFLKRIPKITPSVTEFVNKASTLNYDVEDEFHLLVQMESLGNETSKNLLLDFLAFSKARLSFTFTTIRKKEKTETNEICAYSKEIYWTIAKNLFNEEYIHKNHVLEKSLEKSIDFERWLFLSTFYVCGWRSSDICTNWPYPTNKILQELDLDWHNIKEALLADQIDQNVFFELGSYIEATIELAAKRPHKTGKGNDLIAPITNSLKVFFGRMSLISLYHQNKSGEGRLMPERICEYQSFVKIKEQFGSEIYELLGRNNLHSRRMNKSYMQSIEQGGKTLGMGALLAYSIAAFARNHANLDTTAVYLKDHKLTGETADVVLSMMLDRGVFGALIYAQLLTAFPDAFEKLSPREQTKVISILDCSAYDIEISAAALPAEIDLRRFFIEGNSEKAQEILHCMFEISQGKGRSKDAGIYCTKRALGFACVNPTFSSCIANLCPYSVFTESGIKTLVHVIKQYMTLFEKTGNPKYRAVVNKMKSSFSDVFRKIRQDTDPQTKEAINKAIERIIYDE